MSYLPPSQDPEEPTLPEDEPEEETEEEVMSIDQLLKHLETKGHVPPLTYL